MQVLELEIRIGERRVTLFVPVLEIYPVFAEAVQSEFRRLGNQYLRDKSSVFQLIIHVRMLDR